jgi:DNA-binding FadR family transcriptional regulator
MNYVYIVYYDNGAQYAEDHQVIVDSVFANENDADAYAQEMNQVLNESEEDNWMGWEPSYSVQKAVLN